MPVLFSLLTLDEVSVFVNMRPRCPAGLLGELEPCLECPLHSRHALLSGSQVALHLGHLCVPEPEEGRQEASKLPLFYFSKNCLKYIEVANIAIFASNGLRGQPKRKHGTDRFYTMA